MEKSKDIERLRQVADMLLSRVKSKLEDTQSAELTPQAAKHYSSTLKDIRDIQMCRGEQTEKEGILVEISKEAEVLSG